MAKFVVGFAAIVPVVKLAIEALICTTVKLDMLAVDVLRVMMLANTALANGVFNADPTLTVVVLERLRFNDSTFNDVTLAMETLSVPTVAPVILAADELRSDTFALVTVARVAVKLIAWRVPVTDASVIFANEVFKTGTVRLLTLKVVRESDPMLAV